jgi:hypothetical protein
MAEIETKDFIPTQWQRVTSKPKPRKSISATEAKDGIEVALARGEITLLLKAEKDCQFDLGRLFKKVCDARSHWHLHQTPPPSENLVEESRSPHQVLRT